MLSKIDFTSTLEFSSPHPYSLLTSISKERKPNVMGLSWFMFTSFSPPLIAISVGKTRHTYKNLEEIPEFCLCIPNENIKNEAFECGMLSGKEVDKIKKLNFDTIDSELISPPIIKESTIAYECKIISSLDSGDHTIFVGEILRSYADKNFTKHLYTIDTYSAIISLDHKGK